MTSSEKAATSSRWMPEKIAACLISFAEQSFCSLNQYERTDYLL
ncbi:hypothetical protein [Paenibacillus wulumuqiensis]|nr:hypothetical protein [Paenibacillus wulumuqiensis]